MARPAQSAPGREYLAIGLVSAAVMLYEIAIIRVLSVILWYHFAFLSVSLAMLGLGAPGVWFALRDPGRTALRRSLVIAALAVPLSLAALFWLGDRTSHRAALATVCLLVPLVALGSAVCILLIRARGPRIGWMYGADLAGATLAALAVVPLMHVVPTPLLIAGGGLLPLLALGVLCGWRDRAVWIPAVVVLGLLAWREPFQLRFAKSYTEPPGRLYERWTPLARLTVYDKVFWQTDPQSGFGWGMGSTYRERPVDQLWLEQDSSAGTPITRFDGTSTSLEHLFWDVTSAGYQLSVPARACIIGTGGGRDILTALLAGAQHIDAVELNPYTVDLVSKRFGAFSGDVYHRPGVRAIVGEGRNFLNTTANTYDMIQISLADSWAATTAGGFALSENFLYTVEAYRLYWRRLTSAGMISTSRWVTGSHEVESLRLALLAVEALRQEGVANPTAHLALVQAGSIGTLLVTKQPLTGPQFQQLNAVCEARGFVRRWPLLRGETSQAVVTTVLLGGAKALQNQGLDLSPPTDEKPFFFQAVRVFGRLDHKVIGKLSANERSVVLLRQLMVGVSALALVLFFLPFLLRGKLVRHAGFWPGSAYFAAIGLAFMLIEMPLVQRTVLYLGSPSHATTIVLASLLLGASLGSMAAARRGLKPVQRWGFAIPVVLAVMNLGLLALFRATLGFGFAPRALLGFASLALLGFCMGFPFPAGMMRFDARDRAWFWAVNGAASVVASVFSLALSMSFGFSLVIFAGVALYVVAWLLLRGASPASEATAQG